MSPFVATDKLPEVYIDEIEVAGSIAGVSTSNLAVIGPALKGPINKPTLVTNPTEFQDTFGGHIGSPQRYSSHAVHGFFANGGTSCYFVRVANAARSFLNLADRSGGALPTIRVTAKEEGTSGDAITVQVDDANIVANVDLVKAETTLAQPITAAQVAAGVDTIIVTDASSFRPGDPLLIDEGGASPVTHVILSINNNDIRLDASLANPYLAGVAVRIADLAAADTRVRVADSTGLNAGSYVEISQAGGSTVHAVVASVEPATHALTLDAGLGATFDMLSAQPAVQLRSLEFRLTIDNPNPGAPAPATEVFDRLAMDPRHGSYYRTVVQSNHVDLEPFDNPPNPSAAPDNMPVAMVGPANLANGADDDLTAHSDSLYTDPVNGALLQLESIDEVNMLCAPDRITSSVQAALIQHCEKLHDRFAILDPIRGSDPTNGIRTQRAGLSSSNGHAALYYPWIEIPHPQQDGEVLLVPPSGHIAGLYARTDQQKGIHVAPANAKLNGVAGLERRLNDTTGGQLNELGINVLRFVRNEGFLVWGARTLAPQARNQWRYVNVRRLLLFIEESIQEGMRPAVFAPNNKELWGRIKRQVSEFLDRVYRSGALFGSKPEEAFRVRIDDELNPGPSIALGQLIVEVKVRPTVPAEFIVFRVISDPSRSVIDE